MNPHLQPSKQPLQPPPALPTFHKPAHLLPPLLPPSHSLPHTPLLQTPILKQTQPPTPPTNLSLIRRTRNLTPPILHTPTPLPNHIPTITFTPILRREVLVALTEFRADGVCVVAVVEGEDFVAWEDAETAGADIVVAAEGGPAIPYRSSSCWAG